MALTSTFIRAWLRMQDKYPGPLRMVSAYVSDIGVGDIKTAALERAAGLSSFRQAYGYGHGPWIYRNDNLLRALVNAAHLLQI